MPLGLFRHEVDDGSDYQPPDNGGEDTSGKRYMLHRREKIVIYTEERQHSVLDEVTDGNPTQSGTDADDKGKENQKEVFISDQTLQHSTHSFSGKFRRYQP